MWWLQQAHQWNGQSLKLPEQSLWIQKDASRLGWGAHCRGVKTGGSWMVEEAKFHINYLELLADFLATQAFVRDKTDLTDYIQMDNVTALTYINMRGGFHSLPLTQLAKKM